MSKGHHTKLLSSSLKWYDNVLVLLAILMIVLMAVELMNGGSKSLSTEYIQLVMMVFSFLYFVGKSLWYMRRVTLWDNRVEVTFPLHRKWKHEVALEDIDRVCIESIDKELVSVDFTVYRVYLQTDRKLWLYLSSGGCANYDEMVEALTNYFNIPVCEHFIGISQEDYESLRNGDFIELEDIDQEELQKLREQRLQRQLPDIDAWEKVPWWKTFFLKIYPTVLFIVCLAAFVGFIKFVKFAKTVSSAEMAYIDASTKIPKVRHLIVDSIDVDVNGIRYHNSRYLQQATVVEYWAFPVKGLENVWVTIGLKMKEDEHFPWNEQRDKCIELLHSRQKYERAKEDTYKKRIVHYMSLSSRRVEKVKKKVVLLNRIGNTPIIGGGVYYMEAQDARRSSKGHEPDDNLARSMMLKAAEGGYPKAQYELGGMYLNGNLFSRNVSKALYWYQAAAKQEKELKIKCEALNQISYIYADRHEYDKAIAAIDSAIALLPNNANYYDSKGEHLYKMGDKKGAKKMWEKVISLNPGFEKTNNSELKRLLSP